jgi:hypothetical protein
VDACRSGRKSEGAIEDIGGCLDARRIARGVHHYDLGLSQGILAGELGLLLDLCRGERGGGGAKLKVG